MERLDVGGEVWISTLGFEVLLAARERLLRARLDLVTAGAEWHLTIARARLGAGELR